MTPLRAEFRRLRRLAGPVVVAQVGQMLMGVVDTAMVGHLSTAALGSASMANVWIQGTFLLLNGVLMGMDPLVAQAHGAGHGPRCGLTLQRGLVMASLLTPLLAGLWWLTGGFLALARQDPALVDGATTYALVQIPSVPFLLAFVALRQYLQGREIMRPAMWVVAIANLVNVAGNWVLIYGHLGLPQLGLTGAGIATAFTRIVQLALLLALVLGFRLHEGAWVPWSRAAWSGQGLRQMLAYGLPVGISHGLEVWAFSGSTLLAGLLSTRALAAHTITLNLAAFAFMFPLGISQGAATRVGNLVGAGQPDAAQRAAWVAMAMGAGVMLGAASCFLLFRPLLLGIFTADPAVLELAGSILPVAAAFAIFDGTQVVGCGVLRGMGDTRPAAVYNLLGYWALGLPLGAWLGLRGGAGLVGIWWGLALGLAVVAVLLVARIRARGPATLQLPAFPH